MIRIIKSGSTITSKYPKGRSREHVRLLFSIKSVFLSHQGTSQSFLSWNPQTWKTCSLMSQHTQPNDGSRNLSKNLILKVRICPDDIVVRECHTWSCHNLKLKPMYPRYLWKLKLESKGVSSWTWSQRCKNKYFFKRSRPNMAVLILLRYICCEISFTFSISVHHLLSLFFTRKNWYSELINNTPQGSSLYLSYMPGNLKPSKDVSFGLIRFIALYLSPNLHVFYKFYACVKCASGLQGLA